MGFKTTKRTSLVSQSYPIPVEELSSYGVLEKDEQCQYMNSIAKIAM
jgi:hypothetical protein